MDESILKRASRVKLLLMDCDGVLTDGRLYFSADGEAMKVFHVRDGQGIVSWHTAGFASGIISGRDGEAILKARVRELGMHYLFVRSANKIQDLETILSDAGVTAEETAYIGDDLGDLGPMSQVGLPIAVADAAPEVVACAVYITKALGGLGAVREVTDLLLSARKMD